MASGRAIPVELLGTPPGEPVRYTVADGTTILKGTVLYLTDARTAVSGATLGGPPVGIAAMDKVANDGSTTISVWTHGLFDMEANGAINAGCQVKASDPSEVTPATAAALSGGYMFGVAQETAADAETIVVKVRI